MCGVAGYVGITGESGEDVLRRMAAAQEHRGPDGSGFFTTARTGLAHRRLVIIDRLGGTQPMYSRDGRYVLVYNGEVYNYRELRTELVQLGHSFDTNSDTEVVLAAWTQWGTGAFDRFNGMFALAIVDTETEQVTLARDHFGIKPLYLARYGDGKVLFASEIKPLLATGLVERVPDETTLYRYLRFRVHDDTPNTFFAGITRLMPGQCAVISPDGDVRPHTYTTLYEDLRKGAGHRPYDRRARRAFEQVVRRAIRDRLVSDVPVGTALSGGLDSSTIVTTINDLLASSDEAAGAVGVAQQTFSAVFPGECNDEERYVDVVADNCVDLRVHKVHPKAAEFVSDLTDFVRTQEEPVVSTGPYAQYRVMRAAGEHVTVMLDGQGADELMAGYVPFYWVHIRQLWRRGRRGRAIVELISARDVLWRLGRTRVGERLRRRRRAPVTDLLAAGFREAHAGETFTVNRDDLKARLLDDTFRHSLPALLRAEDRNTMRFSIEGRVPFLDTDLMRLLWSLDDTAILSGGWNKRALRDATRNLLPRQIRTRRDKIGFTAPEDAWLRAMSGHVSNVFASETFAARPYFDQEAVLTAFHAFLRGEAGADTMTFWRLFNTELWLREFIDCDPADPSSYPSLDETQQDQDTVKSDYEPNDGKRLVLPGGGWTWTRLPLQTGHIEAGDDIGALAAKRVAAFFAGLPLEAPDLASGMRGKPWLLFISEKVVAIGQGRSSFVWDVHPGWWARTICRCVHRSDHGIGLAHPATMQLAIGEAGLPRVLTAAAVSVAGKLVGRAGLFYRVAGPSVRAIDGPTQYSAYPANVSAKLAPADPDDVARKVTAAVRAVVPPHVATWHAGTAIVDANDLGTNILGHDTSLEPDVLAAAFADNPLGQARQLTPFAIVGMSQQAETPAHRS
ncbi:asparagine synthase (glutamine-hydrolyzing) [Actinomadura roseirufa]|uniref:asparagine synthase (glutamine-hydrolyzing) n=1 Tax=Actinomadura roseirufa TaxID=2094049 RepID=UPI001040E405|nr:asparagine synthase (glutamine-hydrolyzing) [Actinomadura roseirufa]